MIRYTQGNLLESGAEALVNTVNTVGVMGKGIALMFRERFDLNFRLYVSACKSGEVRVGHMFVTEPGELDGPRWIINFPTKQHWRSPSQIAWINEGLEDLKRVLQERGVRSVAIPPLGAGNGGLDWPLVKARIEALLGDLHGVDILVFEPGTRYQNVAKRKGVEALTPARALIAEAVRRYWLLGMECSLLEIQKLAWFLERMTERQGLRNELALQFLAHRYGPFAPRLNHLLNSLDGSYLHSEKRIADAGPADVIWFDDDRKLQVQAYLKQDASDLIPALDAVTELIAGFESPFGLELLASVDWLLNEQGATPAVPDLRAALARWPAEGVDGAGERKYRLFDTRAVGFALERLQSSALYA